MKKKPLRKKLLLGFSSLVMAALFVWGSTELKAQTVPEAHIPTTMQTVVGQQVSSDYIEANVVSVVDGDTLWVMKQGVRTKVRLIGVDTPESVHPDENKNTAGGKAASQYTREQLPERQTIYLEYDVQSTDKYGRDLAYVFIPNERGALEFYNLELIKQGYGRVMTIKPNTKYEDEFKAAEQIAQVNKTGFWQNPPDVGWEG